MKPEDSMAPAPKRMKVEENNAPGTASQMDWIQSNPISIPATSFNAIGALTIEQNLHLASRDDMEVFKGRQLSDSQKGFRQSI